MLAKLALCQVRQRLEPWNVAAQGVEYLRGAQPQDAWNEGVGAVFMAVHMDAFAGPRLILRWPTGFASAGIAGSGKAPVVHDACGPASILSNLRCDK
jgi:hypothetical protein